QVPCLIIAGENTNAFRSGAVQLWRRIRPDTPLLTVPKTSHLLPVEEPKIVAKAIQDFLAKEVVVHGNQNS
ncbi:MAG: alpha/beta hydrolase, partial [Anaerolineae bacterium]|nr:alpha/beta hydrolase [Anaerolineae bacterium]